MIGLTAFVFHFNRPGFLENAVASVERHAPGTPIVVVDDASSLPAAQRSLERVARRHEVLRPEQRSPTPSRTGGLHANMMHAMEIARERDAAWAIILQDDMQLVRSFREIDLQRVQGTSRRAEASFVVHACFMKGATRQVSETAQFVPISDRMCRREQQSDQGGSVAYSDSGLFDVQRFFEMGVTLGGSEADADAALRAKGLRMAFMADPIMHWLPFPAFRPSPNDSALATARHRLADRISGAGVHPIADMTERRIHELASRPASVPAYAEDWLNAEGPASYQYWSLHTGASNLKARGAWRRMLSRLG